MTPSGNNASPADLYLDLIERALTGTLYADPGFLRLDRKDRELAFRENRRARGLDFPARAETMIGVARMRNLRQLAEDVLARGVPGDFIETGVWRGGACIFMRAILAARGDRERRVWVADSFAGLPPPDPVKYPQDRDDRLHEFPMLAVSIDEVRANFARYGLLDARVEFLEGWFRDTLPAAPIERLALLRLDGDMYESTMQAMQALYEKLSPSGYVIVDDYFLAACRAAVEDFLGSRNEAANIVDIDGVGAYWQKAGGL